MMSTANECHSGCMQHQHHAAGVTLAHTHNTEAPLDAALRCTHTLLLRNTIVKSGWF